MATRKKLRPEDIPEVAVPVPESLAEYTDLLMQTRAAKYYSDEAAKKVTAESEKAAAAQKRLKQADEKAKEKNTVLLNNRQLLQAGIAESYVGDISDPDEMALRLVSIFEAAANAPCMDAAEDSAESSESASAVRSEYPSSADIGSAVLAAISRERMTWEEVRGLTEYLAYWNERGTIDKALCGDFRKPF